MNETKRRVRCANQFTARWFAQRTLLCLLSSLAFAQTNTAPAPATRPALDANRQQEVRLLARQLGGDDWQTRQDAVEKLVKMGPTILPLVRELAAAASGDLEVEYRFQNVIGRIGLDERIGQSVVSINVRNAPARDVLKILEQAGRTTLPVVPAEVLDSAAPVTLELTDAPLLEVLRQFADKQQWRLIAQPNSTAMTLSPGPWSEARGLAAHAGPFMVVLNSAARSDSLIPVEGARPNFVGRLNISIIREPKLRLEGPMTFEIDAATDEAGRSIIKSGPLNPFGAMGFDGSNVSGSPMVTHTLPLQEPAERLSRLKGHIDANLVATIERWEIADLSHLREQTRKINNERWAIRSFSKADQGYDVAIRVPHRIASQWQWGIGADTTPQLLDAQGRGWSPQMTSQSSDGSSMETTIRFTAESPYARAVQRKPGGAPSPEKPGDPVKIVWELPLETVSQTYNFEFRDVPLP